jgi:hypothetical protein
MSHKEITIFLVEDDDADAEKVQRAFAEAHIGNRLIRARDELQARDLMRTQLNEEPAGAHVLLVDPKVTGDWPSFDQRLHTDEILQRALVFVLTDSTCGEALPPNINVAGYIARDDAGHGFLASMLSIGTYVRLVEAPRGQMLH